MPAPSGALHRVAGDEDEAIRYVPLSVHVPRYASPIHSQPPGRVLFCGPLVPVSVLAEAMA